MTTLQTSRRLLASLFGCPLAGMTVQRLDIPPELKTPPPGPIYLLLRICRVRVLHGSFLKASTSPRVLLMKLLGRQVELASGHAARLRLRHSPRVSLRAQVVEKLSPWPVLCRSFARLHSPLVFPRVGPILLLISDGIVFEYPVTTVLVAV